MLLPKDLKSRLIHYASVPDMRESMRMISSGMKMKISLSNGQMIH